MKSTLFTLVALVGMLLSTTAFAQVITDPVGKYSSPIGAEISAFDPGSGYLFTVNGSEFIQILSLADPANPSLVTTVNIESLGLGAGANSCASKNGYFAVAIENDNSQANGVCAFFSPDGSLISSVPAGALPDMVTFSPDGNYALVANEGEPNDDYTVDPEGSVTIIDVSGGAAAAAATQVSLAGFNGASLDASIRIFGPGATVAQDLEPEYIAVTADSKTAYVACQENNCFAVIDIPSATATDLLGLGFKDHSLPGNQLDASNEDGGINIQNWPVFGIYQPDAIDYFTANGQGYIITANEGDAREYEGNPGFVDEDRIKDVVLDPVAFPNAADLQKEENLGRLKLTLSIGDTDNDGDYDELYCFGGRSFSIYDLAGNQVFDSGDDFEKFIAANEPASFVDNRSDDKGPEPESITVFNDNGKKIAIIGCERSSGLFFYDVSVPSNAKNLGYLPFPGGGVSPEGLLVIDAEDSPNGERLLVISNEVSNDVVILSLDSSNVAAVPTMGEWALFLFGLLVLNLVVVTVYNKRRQLAA